MKNHHYSVFTRMAQAAILLFTPALLPAATISLLTSTNTVTVGNTFQVDLVATGIQLGAYDVTFGYNPLLALIDENLVTSDVHLGGPDNSFTFLFAGLDSLELGEVSFLTNPSDLAALQSDPSFPLAHIQVEALAVGTLSLDFISNSFTTLSDYNGNAIDGVVFQGASINIVAAGDPDPTPPPAEAPEPGTILFLLSGLCFLLSAGLRKRTRALGISKS